MISITKASLEKMYFTTSNKEICKKFGITNPTLISYLKYYDIKLKGKGNRENKRKVKLVK